MLITIVTINYSSSFDLMSTCASIDKQLYRDFQHLVVASGYDQNDIQFLETSLSKHYRHIVWNQDSGIYNAMNLGMRLATGKFIIFMNSGDCFLQDDSLGSIINMIKRSKQNQYTKCLTFSSIQHYQTDFYLRPPGKYFGLNHSSYAHQSFVAPLEKNKSDRIYFNEKNYIAADQEWMRANVKRYGIRSSILPISFYALGGISSAPSRRSIYLLIGSRQYALALKSVVRLCISLLIPRNLLYRILAFRAGYLYFGIDRNIELPSPFR